MIIDTSVILHIFFEEVGWQTSVAYLLKQDRRLVSTPSLIEAQAVIIGRTTGSPEDAKSLLDDLLTNLCVEFIPLSVKQAQLAREAYLAFGKGRGHKAQLNFGDVMVYALAKDYGELLAFVGDDFNHTDLDVVKFPLG